MTDERLVELEIRLAHQDQALTELNAVMSQQQASIMKLEELCKAIATRMATLGESFGNTDGPEERPPHY
jgi:SlyX protein